MSALVSAADLAELLAGARPPRLVDVRYRLDKPDGSDDHRAGHIPGAVYADHDTELATHGAPSDGRHPLPSCETLQTAVRRWGVNHGDTVVVYDGGTTMGAARAWWLLRGSGIDVRVLDGGLTAWQAAGGDLETGEVTPEPGDATLRGTPNGIDIADAGVWPEHGVLVDVRAAERYRGETEPLDPVAGHIPGAVNLPASNYLNPDGTFRAAEEIAAAFDAVGATEDEAVAVYCGSGVTAAQAALAADIAGRHVALYPGSWSAWSNTPGRPVATGTERNDGPRQVRLAQINDALAGDH
ncbi:sulfurtransferase [Microbacterium gorillae]|uniref:sulfurtransferase n=1 Tax=Microbacterium gorillae TaxID=1231063 RepID=UPI000B024D5A|nr:sulfurtransferase [Microbacterium gorillae]